MPCQQAMIKDVYTLKPDNTVADALKLFNKRNLRAAPVVNGEGGLLGVFDFNALLDALLPVSVPGLEHFAGIDINLDNIGDTSNIVAGRLAKKMHAPVGDIMRRDVTVAHPGTHMWEAVRLLVKDNNILPVVEKETSRLLGLITPQSVTGYLLKQVENHGA